MCIAHVHRSLHSQVNSREKHNYLKIIKSIDSANRKQEMAEEAAAAASVARAREQVRSRRQVMGLPTLAKRCLHICLKGLEGV